MDNSEGLVEAARGLRDAVDALRFSAPVACVYNPLRYAWSIHEAYLRRFGRGRKRVLFLGMNPGPFGMAQTGVPFGEVAVVRDWLGLAGAVDRPDPEHPKRPVSGFACERSEVSGRRLWGLFAEIFETPEVFFADHFVANYCPLVFMTASGGNLTPDKLASEESGRLFAACDAHLRAMVAALRPQWLVGVGAFAERRAAEALTGTNTKVRRILHPSPASPAANQGWAGVARGELVTAGIWR